MGRTGKKRFYLVKDTPYKIPNDRKHYLLLNPFCHLISNPFTKHVTESETTQEKNKRNLKNITFHIYAYCLLHLNELCVMFSFR